MGLHFQRRIPLSPNVWINLSAGWPSLTVRLGRVTFNTRRGFSSVRLGHGLSYRDQD